MNALLALLVVVANPGTVERDKYGVPLIRAQSIPQAFRLAGQSVAEDRLYQMHLSRLAARGKMASIRGRSAVASDAEIFRLGYTDDEMLSMFSKLPKHVRQAWQSYADGVNVVISQRSPEMEPWTVLDSAGIAIQMSRRFGSGGSGELRNMALYSYLKTQKGAPQVIDILDDFAWWNDPASPTTLQPEDDPNPKREFFVKPTREQTEKHLASLPPANLLELLPTIRLAAAEESAKVAMQVGSPYKVGSYAVVVGPKRSETEGPLLLGAPQMGHTSPSIIHEVSIQCPEYKATGMSVPGIPGVLIGTGPHMSWTLTSGVADVSDIYFFTKNDQGQPLMDGEVLPVETTKISLKVKDGEAVEVVRQTTPWGPVVLDSRSGNALYVQRSTLWKKELQSYSALFEFGQAKDSQQLQPILKALPLSFNFFYAFKDGTIGWRYCGHVPIRPEGFDPRFPLPGSKAADWKGIVPPDQMPAVENPKSGLLVNWNNKPAQWWPNLDTPVWGHLFRVLNLQRSLKKPVLSSADLILAAQAISRSEETTSDTLLAPTIEVLKNAELTPEEAKARNELVRYQLWREEGQASYVLYDEMIQALREDLFLPMTGNFGSADAFKLVAQGSVIDNALFGRTKFDYLRGRTTEAVLLQAFKEAVKRTGSRTFVAGQLRYSPELTVPFGVRGTFIQVVEIGDSIVGRSIAAPGQSESGPHQYDQVDLARYWLPKRMHRVE